MKKEFSLDRRRRAWRRPGALLWCIFVLVIAVSAAPMSIAVEGAVERTHPGATVDTARLSVDVPGLSPATLRMALCAYERALQRGEVERPILSIIDYSLPSTAKRLWVLDLEHRRLLFHELVAHGRGTGDVWARAFSNRAGSHQSSLGLFRTGAAYRGRHGPSLRLRGLEPGINDRAEERAIVLHGAAYVSESYARSYGRIGRSFGCPVVPAAVADTLIQTIRDGTLLFAAFPDTTYTARSLYVAPPAGR